jgi:hypothetical protein
MASRPHPRPGERDPRAIIAASFPAMAALARALQPEIRLVEEKLRRDEKSGCDVSGLRHILRELRWRLESTADVAAACESLKRLRLVEAAADPPSALDRNEDGSYGLETDVWFLKLEASIDALLLAGCEPVPQRPRFLDPINDPERLLSYLSNLLLSKPAEDGVDRRKELNLSTANLVRLILRRLPKGYPWHRELEAAIRGFIARWQDPQTGFFGAFYQVGQSRWRTADLSLTFHMARYLDGEIGCWPQLADTLLAMREERYPNGWLDEEGMTSHHNYDVATLFRLGWSAMRPDQRQEAARELDRLLEWCLGSAIAADGRIVARAAGESLFESYYFAIAFLDTVGCFASGRPFWSDRAIARAEELRAALERQLARLYPRHPMTRMAFARLSRNARAGAPRGRG